MTGLSAPQLQAVQDAVRVVVNRAEDGLAAIAADVGDLYVWTRDYGQHGTVDFEMPPGEPSQWPIDVADVSGQSRLHVVVPMWTRQEGRSDLSLEVELCATPSGEWMAHILDLHVL